MNLQTTPPSDETIVSLLHSPDEITQEITVYTATATFIDGDTKTYTYYNKEVHNGSITLYDYDEASIRHKHDVFTTHSVPDPDNPSRMYSTKVPCTPTITPQQTIETHHISLETCKDFEIEEKTTETISLNTTDWGGCVVDLPRKIAEAYVEKYGSHYYTIQE